MNNPRITIKERNLLKGAIRRVFSRSDLRRAAIEEAIIEGYFDKTRLRVKKWGKCAGCSYPTPKSYLVVDHIEPIIPLDKSLEEMSWDEVINRIWCNGSNLQALCESCHDVKTKEENRKRRIRKKERLKNGK